MVDESLYRWFSLILHIYGTCHSGYFKFYVIICNSLIFTFNNLFVSPLISKPYFYILRWSHDLTFPVLQKCNFGFFPSYPGDVGKVFRFAILDGGMERWSLFNWKYIYLLFKTLQWWVLYLSQIFFLFGYEQKVLPHKRGTLSKNLAAKFWKNKLSLAMQLQKFHFFLFLFSSQTRKLLKYKDPVEKTFNVRVRVELMTGKEPVQ